MALSLRDAAHLLPLPTLLPGVGPLPLPTGACLAAVLRPLSVLHLRSSPVHATPAAHALPAAPPWLQEALASELAARMNAMNSASDNAAELKRTLTLVMNRKRQAKITTELTVSAPAGPAWPGREGRGGPGGGGARRRYPAIACAPAATAQQSTKAVPTLRSTPNPSWCVNHAHVQACECCKPDAHPRPAVNIFLGAGDCGGRCQRVRGAPPFSGPASLCLHHPVPIL